MNQRFPFLRQRTASALAALLVFGGGVAASVTFPVTASANSDNDLRQRIEVMERQLKEMKAELQATKQKADAAQQKAETARTQAGEEDSADIKWHLGGYGFADYTATDSSSGSNSFGGGHFNPIFLVNYKDLVSFEGELEISTTTDGGTDTQLEFANLNLNATDWLTVTAGKFLSPLGDFQQHSHPAWINKLPDRPAGFVEDGGTEHLNEAGLMLHGAVPLGSTTLEYAAFVGNGPQLATSADGGVKLEAFASDDNRNKAYGGRIGFRPLPYIDIGLSGMRSKIKGNTGTGGTVTTADYDMAVADASFTKGNWDLRGEFIQAHLARLMTALETTTAPQSVPATTWRAWYAQAAYRLAGVTDNRVLRNFEPIARYSQFHISGASDFQTNEEDRWTLGLDYWFAPSIVAKAAYEAKDFHNKADEDVFRAQFAFGF